MEPLNADPALQAYAVCSAILAFQLLALANWTGGLRTKRKVFVNPEDARLSKGTQAATEHEDVARVKRAHLNALENAVPFFVVAYLYILTGPSAKAAWIYFGTFTAARILHSVFYLFGRQPFRTIFFAVGVLATVGMGVKVLMVAL